MKKKKVLISCGILAVLIISLSLVMLHSSLEYKVMAYTEALKSQLKEEYQTYTGQLFESVEVDRLWYSFSPTDWTFVVTLAPNSETMYYKYVDGVFVTN